MEVLAAAFWGGFFTVAAFMLACAVAAAARGFRRMAAVAATYSLVPSLFVGAYIGLFALHDDDMHRRFLSHITVLGAAGLTSQLLLVLRGYRKPASDQRLKLGLLLLGCAVLAVSWFIPARWGFVIANVYGFALGLWLIAVAVRKALRGTRIAWISVGGVSLALVSLGSLGVIAAYRPAVPLAVHAIAAVSSIFYVAIMAWAMWMRYAYALELKQVLTQGPSFDPVTRLPAHGEAGKLVNAVLGRNLKQPLGVIAISLANLAALEQLHGRAAYNHALYVSAGRLRRSAPMGAQLGRLGEDGFLVLLRTDDFELLKHVAGKVRHALAQAIHVGADVPSAEGHSKLTEWAADVGIGITLRKDPDTPGAAVITARTISRAAFAAESRIVFAQGREAKEVVEVN